MRIDDNDIRWKQRFQNFRRAFNLLREALEDEDIDKFSDLEKEGIIQRFEYTFELGWKVFKDYLEFNGIMLSEATPRKVIKECASSNVFAAAEINPEIYMDMMFSRNTLSHVYDLEYFKQVIAKIQSSYLCEFEKEYTFFTEKELNGDG